MLSPLESRENIIVTHTAQSLEVLLPRLHLLFFVSSNGELESRSMPNYVVDKTQSCGTLFGLRNKLILCPRPNSSEESLLPRRIIIPQGNVSYCTMGDFASVSINTDGEEQVRWYEYTIDTDLGCLTSNTSLRSKLYQCYLHALTSHCLPDPLLGHTGTEEALYMLRGAACRSFQRLDGHEAKLLELISDLTPKRVYYPPHSQSMATVQWNDLPALSQHHDFFGAACNILDHARVLEALYDPPTTFNTLERNQSLLNRAASRNELYYPSDLRIPEKPSSSDDVEYRSRDIYSHGSAEHIAYQTSWSIWKFRPSLDRNLLNLWDLMSSWGSVGPADSGISLGYSQYWLKFDAPRDWFVIYDLCRNAINEGLRSTKIKLSFCLSAATYSKSKYSYTIPFFIAFALDERFHFLRPPQDLVYTPPDGVAPGFAHLWYLVSLSALPVELIPVNLLNLVEAPSNQSKLEKKLRRKEAYDASIQRESSLTANLILYQWPDYESVDLNEQLFNKSEYLRGIKIYAQSISRNVQLYEHVLRLLNILQGYVDAPIPTTAPYEFLPQFITSRSKVPLYFIRDTFLSRTNFMVRTPSADTPFIGDGIPRATATTGTPATVVGPDNLKILIEEFRRSRQSLLQRYGNELNKSHRKLGQFASQSQAARGAIPSHEFLSLYRDGCSHRKDRIFSEISAILAPSQNVEKSNAFAGLWPRITPRSLLRQLAQDLIDTLPDQWKAVITRYAVCFLKYQQSQRLLELFLSQKREELLREIESMRSGVLAESTPDWLLVQVRPIWCRYIN